MWNRIYVIAPDTATVLNAVSSYTQAPHWNAILTPTLRIVIVQPTRPGIRHILANTSGLTLLPGLNNPAGVGTAAATALEPWGVVASDTAYEALVKLYSATGAHVLDPDT